MFFSCGTDKFVHFLAVAVCLCPFQTCSPEEWTFSETATPKQRNLLFFKIFHVSYNSLVQNRVQISFFDISIMFHLFIFTGLHSIVNPGPRFNRTKLVSSSSLHIFGLTCAYVIWLRHLIRRCRPHLNNNSNISIPLRTPYASLVRSISVCGPDSLGNFECGKH